MTGERNQPSLAAALVNASEETQALVEAAAGYRNRCKAAGFTDESAEAMAVAYHETMITFYRVTALRGQANKGSDRA